MYVWKLVISHRDECEGELEQEETLYHSEAMAEAAMDKLLQEEISEYAGEDATIERLDSWSAYVNGGLNEGGIDVDIYKCEVH